jgi:hypothetical protein
MTEVLKPITYNKSIVFYSPLEGDDVLVRTGTIDNDSFYHSILHATSKEYLTMDKDRDRIEFVKKLKNSIFATNDVYIWKKTEESKKTFIDNVNDLFENFYEFLQSPNPQINKNKISKKLIKTEELLQYHILISQLIDLNTIKETITDVSSKTENVDDFKSKFLKKVLKTYVNIDEIKELEKDKRTEIQLLIENMIQRIYKTSEKTSYEMYQQSLIKNQHVNNSILNQVSTHLDRDIYLLNGDERVPFELHIDEKKENKKAIILIKIGEHYEVVGRLLPGNKIQREFLFTDNLIQKIRTFTFNPDVEKQKYIRTRSRSRSITRSRSPSRSDSPSRSRSRSPTVSRSSGFPSPTNSE